MSTFTLQSFFLKYLLGVPSFTVLLMAHVSSNQYGQSFASFIKAVFFFAIIQDQMKEVIEAWSRFVHGYKLDMQVSVVTEMEILVTHAPHG